MKVLTRTLLPVILALTLSACATGRYEVKPDGSTVIDAREFMTNQTMDSLSVTVNPDGSRSLSIKGRKADQTTGLDKINQGLKMILQGLAEGAADGVTP